jgi:hypothetical protein
MSASTREPVKSTSGSSSALDHCWFIGRCRTRGVNLINAAIGLARRRISRVAHWTNGVLYIAYQTLQPRDRSRTGQGADLRQVERRMSFRGFSAASASLWSEAPRGRTFRRRPRHSSDHAAYGAQVAISYGDVAWRSLLASRVAAGSVYRPIWGFHLARRESTFVLFLKLLARSGRLRTTADPRGVSRLVSMVTFLASQKYRNRDYENRVQPCLADLVLS